MSHTVELCSVDPERCIRELESSTLVPAASGNVTVLPSPEQSHHKPCSLHQELLGVGGGLHVGAHVTALPAGEVAGFQLPPSRWDGG